MCILCISEQKLAAGRGVGIGLCSSSKLKDRCFTVHVGPFYSCGNRAGQKVFHGNDIWYTGIWILDEKFLHFCWMVSQDSAVWFFCIFSPNCTSLMHCHWSLVKACGVLKILKHSSSVQDSDCLVLERWPCWLGCWRHQYLISYSSKLANFSHVCSV